MKVKIIAEIGSNWEGNISIDKKIISESRQKLNEDLKIKREEIQKKIDEENYNTEKEIKKFKIDSINKVNGISQEITSHLIKDIFGEELNKSSIEAAVTQSIKDYQGEKS